MRLIGSLETHVEAVGFQKHCRMQKIEILLDKALINKKSVFQIWVVDEDDTEKAQDLLATFIKNPDLLLDTPDDLLQPIEAKVDERPQEEIVKKGKWPLLTWLWILVTTVCFFIQMGQEVALVEDKGTLMMNVALTPIEESFFFDVPEGFSQIKNFLIDKGIKTESDLKSLSADELKTFETLKEVSYFHGFLDMLEDASYKQSYLNQKWPLFKKIKEGEVLRLFTPVFLHGSILHILFNMLWIFVLMKQIEAKLGILKTGALALILAMISNTCQYLVSGPFFVGASGIIVGLAAFIWVRQKKAPWEGYIFSKTLIVFLMVYVLSLVILSMGIVVFNISNHKNLAFGIANTAHVAGGLCGLFLGLTKIFRRR